MSVTRNIGRMLNNTKRILKVKLEDTQMDERIILKRILEKKWKPGYVPLAPDKQK